MAENPDYRSMFESDYIGSWDLVGKDRTLEIKKVVGGEIVGEGGRKSKKPIIHFSNARKPMVLNKTNGATIAAMYGTDTRQWVGKLITIFATTTKFGGKTVDCIRVRPKVPKSGSQQPPEPEPETEQPPPEEERVPGGEG